MNFSISSWKLLAIIPQIRNCGGKFFVFFDNIHNLLFVIGRSTGFLQYSFDTNSWIRYEIKSSNTSLPSFYYDAATIDYEEKTLYCYETKSVTKFQIMNNSETKMEIIELPFEIGDDFKAIIIKDECHIIGGDYNNKHIKYNTKTHKHQIIHDFKQVFNLDNLYWHQLIKIQNKLLIFGGCDGNNYLDTVYQYDIITNKWNKLKCKMPKSLSLFGCTSILNGNYVVLLGGKNHDGYQDNIYFYSVRDQKFKISKIKCPERSLYQAITMNDKKKDTLTTFGFVRCKWKECKISDHLFPPQYLITIICGYYLNEFIHLFNDNNRKHHKINVFDIIEC